MDVPVISLWQPFASLIFTWDRDLGEFAKAFETRGFKLPTRLIGQRAAVRSWQRGLPVPQSRTPAALPSDVDDPRTVGI
jgi:hypothetical protein